jgi:hypothetical protein
MRHKHLTHYFRTLQALSYAYGYAALFFLRGAL